MRLSVNTHDGTIGIRDSDGIIIIVSIFLEERNRDHHTEFFGKIREHVYGPAFVNRFCVFEEFWILYLANIHHLE
ncbi:hypothetical protein AR158_c105L [Paramecium bursaria Chlorella virus AR158]|uniref:hypothetical protein n=1 Tax=Paramecium bursaria Chlorella virus AR158 TaxID=380598 RepID=UPI00015AA7AF|nr:hypothetical protein AR158_c105L [Paramecium bursaria Chlorella virus AR158]ABU43651.1 hypothetical protein AR158_c105L [Paramecium bursaria Chlorella virus AR158]